MLTQADLKLLLNYDKDTGIFTRKVSKNNRFPVGSIAGGIGSKGYINIFVNKKYYKAHRLAWLYVYGYSQKSRLTI